MTMTVALKETVMMMQATETTMPPPAAAAIAIATAKAVVVATAVAIATAVTSRFSVLTGKAKARGEAVLRLGASDHGPLHLLTPGLRRRGRRRLELRLQLQRPPPSAAVVKKRHQGREAAILMIVAKAEGKAAPVAAGQLQGLQPALLSPHPHPLLHPNLSLSLSQIFLTLRPSPVRCCSVWYALGAGLRPSRWLRWMLLPGSQRTGSD